MASRTRSGARKQASASSQTPQAARGAGQKGRAKAKQTANKASPDSDVPDVDTSGLSASDAQALAKLLKKAKDAKKADKESHVKGVRKRVATMIRDEEGSSEEEQPKRKKKKKASGDSDQANSSGAEAEMKDSADEDEDAAVDEEVRSDEHKESQENHGMGISEGTRRRKFGLDPKPAYRGAQQTARKSAYLDKDEAIVAKSLGATASTKGKSKAVHLSDDSRDDSGYQDQQIATKPKKLAASPSSKKTISSGDPPSPSVMRRKVYIDVPVPAKSSALSSAVKANNKGKEKKTGRHTSASSSDDSDAHKSDDHDSDEDEEYEPKGGKGSDEDEEDDDELEEEDDDDGVVVLPEQMGKSKQKRSKGRGRRERAKVTDLPIDVRALVTAAQNCLRLRISLKTAWTSESSVVSGRLLKRDALIRYSVEDARDMRDKDGKRIKALKRAFQLISPKSKSKDEKPEREKTEKEREEEEKAEQERLELQQNVYTVVWASASQFRNELKRKAKVAVDQMYGLQGLSAEQRSAVAAWLLRTHATDVVEGGSRHIPNFVFSDIDIVFDQRKRLDLKATTFNQDEPFRHEAIAELIYQQWALGARADANIHAAMDDFRKVPDNLIAVVCNAIESALTEVVIRGQANFFANKQFAAKWDGLMAILATLKAEAPEHYRETKAIIWAQISGRMKANTVDEEESDNGNGSFLKIDRLRSKVGKGSPVQERKRATSISTSQALKPASMAQVASTSSSPRRSGAPVKPPSGSGKPTSSSAKSSAKTSSAKSPKRGADQEVDELDKEDRDEPEGEGVTHTHEIIEQHDEGQELVNEGEGDAANA
ncbi:uncharacterized protein B0H18DRAFT_1130475 [Fomitopsis serialis]|uniref:uncharacterized protein n=1 Tax=Fomitopsis serialis TaxID=139415 RepID=UPI002007B140|nr:uncharacterized protein B0H18DRAFT_1130475 [Neoantrodia serialis]KAH9910245.1 hypothetical protein B0H18DRAFT_1130475 [Neoantrodia serialis]